MHILMIVAHPDDEVVFGFRDIVHNSVHVISLTNGDNEVRRGEFYSVMSTIGGKGDMLNYVDSPEDTWADIPVEDFYRNNIMELIVKSMKYELVVSHGSDGEYGNKQHIRVHNIARNVASEMGLPFQTFRDRYRVSDYATYKDKYEKLVGLYKSQNRAIAHLANFFENAQKKGASKNGKVIEGVKPNRSLLLRSGKF